MNICFVSNFEKTKVFDAVAQELIKHNNNIFWIAVNTNYYRYLSERYPQESILLINKEIKQVETTFSQDCKLNEIVYNDRFLSLDLNKGISFLKKAQGHIYNFLIENKIEAIFGELTWAHELLISRIANSIDSFNCNYFNPHAVRIPNKRFAFFQQEKDQIELDYNVNYALLDYKQIKLEQPDYLKRNDDKLKQSFSLKVRLKRVSNFLTKKNIQKNDPSLLNGFIPRFKRGFKEEYNKTIYKTLNTTSFSDLKDEKYIVFTLHKQPEASIDVLGRYYNNQLLLIRQIWQILPSNWTLVVKEHSNAIGDRDISFYRKVASLPNVILVDAKTNSHKLIQNCQAVFTISGTIAYEAALMKKTAFTFTEVFFNKLMYCHKINLDDLNNCRNLEGLISEFNLSNHKKMGINTFSNFIYHHSYEGLWSPSNKESFSHDNIEKLSSAIRKLTCSTP